MAADRLPADPTAEPPRDVHAVLEEIGAAGAFADLEARVRDLEQDLERAEARSRQADGGRQGQLELMRTRIDEAMELVRSSMEEQRSAFRRFEERFGGLVAGSEQATRSYVDELRGELTPRVQRTILRAEEIAAELRGELRAVEEAAAGRSAAVGRILDEARGELRDRIGRIEATRTDERQDREAALAEVTRSVDERLTAAEETARNRDEQERGRVEALRRELDAAVGELRAGVNLRAADLLERIEDVRLELTRGLEVQQEVSEGLEERWVEATRDIAQRVEQVAAMARETSTGERVAREAAHDELGRRVDELAHTVAELRDRTGIEETRSSGELEAIRRSTDELAHRLASLESRVTDAVGLVASRLTNQVAEVGGDLEALAATTVRHEERLAELDHVERRVSELVARADELASARPDPDGARLAALVERLGDLRQRDRVTDGRLQALHEQVRQLDARLAGFADAVASEDALRQEVRELAATTSELNHRLGEAERVARAAGQAVSRALRSTQPNAALVVRPGPAAEERPAASGSPGRRGEIPQQGGEAARRGGEVPRQGGEVPRRGGEAGHPGGPVGRPDDVPEPGSQRTHGPEPAEELEVLDATDAEPRRSR